MQKSPVTQTQIKKIKARAKEIKSSQNVTQIVALNISSKEHRFNDWAEVNAYAIGIRDKKTLISSWSYPLDLKDESSEPPPKETHFSFIRPFSPEGYKSWLLRDDKNAGLWIESLSDRHWRAIADGLNVFGSSRPNYDELKYIFRFSESRTHAFSEATKLWVAKALVLANDYFLWPSSCMTSDELCIEEIIRLMYECNEFCNHFGILSDAESPISIYLIENKILSKDGAADLKESYRAVIGLAVAFRTLPWTCIAPFETMPTARRLFKEEDQFVLAGCAQFFIDYGVRFDDNDNIRYGIGAQWNNQMESKDKNSFSTNIGLNLTSFHNPAVVHMYEEHLRCIEKCFDPSNQFNVDALTSIKRQRLYGADHPFDFDLKVVHSWIQQRSQLYTEIVKELKSEKTVTVRDLRIGMKSLPESILDYFRPARRKPRYAY